MKYIKVIGRLAVIVLTGTALATILSKLAGSDDQTSDVIRYFFVWFCIAIPLAWLVREVVEQRFRK